MRRDDRDTVATVTLIRALLATGVPSALIYDLPPCVRGLVPQLQRCAASVLYEQLGQIQVQITALRHAGE